MNDNTSNKKYIPTDSVLTSLILIRVISKLIPTGYGMVIELFGNLEKLYPNIKKVVVSCRDAQVLIDDITNRDNCNMFKDGDCVKMMDLNNQEN